MLQPQSERERYYDEREWLKIGIDLKRINDTDAVATVLRQNSRLLSRSIRRNGVI